MTQKTTIEISHKLRDFLIKKSTRKNQSYEEVLWMLIGNKEIAKEDSQQIPPKYIKKLDGGKKVR